MRVTVGLERLRSLLPLALGAIALVALWWKYPHDYIISDPSVYAQNAYWVAHGQFAEHGLSDGVFQQRFGVFLPVALAYALFGATPHTTDLPLLLALLTVLWVVWVESSGRARWFGVFCVVTCEPLASGMTVLFPDLIVSAFMVLSVLALSRRTDTGEPRQHVRRALLGVLAWYCAMLTKETACWVLPLWAGALAVDVFRRRRELLLWFYGPALLAALVLGALYLWFCSHYYGDALARIHTLQSLTGKHFWTIRSADRLTERLGYGPPHFFWKHYAALPVLALCGLFVLPKNRRIWGFYGVTAVLFYWFGSTSLTSYQPLPFIARMSLPCAPAFCLCAGFALSWLSDHLLRPLDPRHGFVLTALLAAVLLLAQLTDFVQGWVTPPDLQAMAVLRRELREHPDQRYLVLTAEPRSAPYVRMSLGFEVPKNVTLSYVGTAHRDDLSGVNAAILVSDPRTTLGARGPNFARQFQRLRLPALFQAGDVAVFLAADVAAVAPLLAR